MPARANARPRSAPSAADAARARPDATAAWAFFAGKGGVGKTSCAAAYALGIAEQGARVLVVSTDPAHSLGDALGVRLGAAPKRVATRRGALLAVELDADRALGRWLRARRDALASAAAEGTWLERDDVQKLFRLEVPGVDELVGLVELERLAGVARCEHVVVDTAPTGHTLRLLAMPETLLRVAEVFAAMRTRTQVVARALVGRAATTAADEVVRGIAAQARALHARLRDGARARFHWVMLPEELSLDEARDGVAALRASGIHLAALVLNRLTPKPPGPCAFCAARICAERAVAIEAARSFPGIAHVSVAALEREPTGVAALRGLARALHGRGRARGLPGDDDRGARRASPRGAVVRRQPTWLDALAPAGTALLLVGGKGGVGKSTCAASIALALARRDPARRVLLLSTDPAHSLGDVLAQRVGDRARAIAPRLPALVARELDADRAFAAERARYRAAVDALFDHARGASSFDAALDREVIQRLIDLSPPGVDELFALRSVVRALLPAPGRRARYDLLVVDTAPTGHTLRLLALPRAALEWVHALLAVLLKYRAALGLGALAADLLAAARDLKRLGALFADPGRTRFVPVTRAAELPARETARLLAALDALDVRAGAVLVNALVPAGGCARCERQRARERTHVRALARALDGAPAPCAIIEAPAVAPPPRGAAALEKASGLWQCAGR